MSENNNSRGMIITSIVVVIVIGVGIFAYNSMKSSSPSSNDTTNSMTKNVMNKDNETVMVGGASMYKDKDIISNVVNAPNLSTLVTAVKAADLATTLQGAGPFTVFGPDNNAFAKLPAGTVETLIKPENKMKLQTILKYHVVSGKYLISDLKDGQLLSSVQGESLKVSKSGDSIMINGAKITTKDVLQSNGVAHVIDTVLMPTGEPDTTMVGGAAMYKNKDIVSNVVNAPNLSTLVTAVKAADLATTLQGAGPFTVFGPDNNAFAKLPAGTVETLIKPENKATLTNILTYHVVSGKYTIDSLTDGQVLTTVQGQKLTIKKMVDKITITDAKGGMSTIITPNVFQSNGVAHVIDTILMPA